MKWVVLILMAVASAAKADPATQPSVGDLAAKYYNAISKQVKWPEGFIDTAAAFGKTADKGNTIFVFVNAKSTSTAEGIVLTAAEMIGVSKTKIGGFDSAMIVLNTPAGQASVVVPVKEAADIDDANGKRDDLKFLMIEEDMDFWALDRLRKQERGLPGPPRLFIRA